MLEHAPPAPLDHVCRLLELFFVLGILIRSEEIAGRFQGGDSDQAQAGRIERDMELAFAQQQQGDDALTQLDALHA